MGLGEVEDATLLATLLTGLHGCKQVFELEDYALCIGTQFFHNENCVQPKLAQLLLPLGQIVASDGPFSVELVV